MDLTPFQIHEPRLTDESVWHVLHCFHQKSPEATQGAGECRIGSAFILHVARQSDSEPRAKPFLQRD